MIGLMGAPGVDVQANGRARQPFGGTAGDGDRRERGVAISGDPGRVVGPQRRADAGNRRVALHGCNRRLDRVHEAGVVDRRVGRLEHDEVLFAFAEAEGGVEQLGHPVGLGSRRRAVSGGQVVGEVAREPDRQARGDRDPSEDQPASPSDDPGAESVEPVKRPHRR